MVGGSAGKPAGVVVGCTGTSSPLNHIYINDDRGIIYGDAKSHIHWLLARHGWCFYLVYLDGELDADSQ